MATSTIRTGWRAAAWAGVLLLVGAATARGQEVRTDPRWQPWLGCWEAEDVGGKPEARTGPRAIVCVIPGDDAASVEIASLSDSRVVNRETVSAMGTQRNVAREGCTGWERAAWSPGGERVYVRAEYACGGGVTRRSSGMMAMTPDGEWLDIQAVTVRDRTGLRVVRYRPAGPGVVLAEEIAVAVQAQTGATRTSRLAAGSSIRTEDVVEASREVDATVVQAWLAERGQGFVLSGRRLVELADAGVPGETTDLMVALSFPRVFQVNPASREGERLADGVSAQAPLPRYGYQPYVSGGYYSPYGWDPYLDMYGPGRYGWYSPYGWNAYGYSPYGYGYSPYDYRYGYSPYGNGYGYGYGSWYWGNQPIVIIDGSGSGSVPAGGRVVNGRGYTRPGASDGTGAHARPRETPSSSTSGGSSGGSGGSSGSSGSSSGGSSSSGSSGSTGHVAHPRPPSD